MSIVNLYAHNKYGKFAKENVKFAIVYTDETFLAPKEFAKKIDIGRFELIELDIPSEKLKSVDLYWSEKISSRVTINRVAQYNRDSKDFGKSWDSILLVWNLWTTDNFKISYEGFSGTEGNSLKTT